MNHQIIVVEITRTDTVYDSSQTIPLTIHHDRQDNYYLSLRQCERIRAQCRYFITVRCLRIAQIRSKIIEVVRLGSNYRHPLLFDVQIVPGDGTDAIIASTERSPKRKRKTSRIR